MHTTNLRKVGGSVMLAVPPAILDLLHLEVGNTVGLAVGSAALAENMRALMFPNMDFRSTFAQSSSNGGQTLCAKREAQQARTKLAYLWAVRLPNTPPPSLRIRNAAYLPQGGSGTIPAETFNETTWTAIGSVKHWQLTPESGSAAIDVPVTAEMVNE